MDNSPPDMSDKDMFLLCLYNHLKENGCSESAQALLRETHLYGKNTEVSESLSEWWESFNSMKNSILPFRSQNSQPPRNGGRDTLTGQGVFKVPINPKDQYSMPNGNIRNYASKKSNAMNTDWKSEPQTSPLLLPGYPPLVVTKESTDQRNSMATTEVDRRQPQRRKDGKEKVAEHMGTRASSTEQHIEMNGRQLQSPLNMVNEENNSQRQQLLQKQNLQQQKQNVQNLQQIQHMQQRQNLPQQPPQQQLPQQALEQQHLQQQFQQRQSQQQQSQHQLQQKQLQQQQLQQQQLQQQQLQQQQLQQQQLQQQQHQQQYQQHQQHQQHQQQQNHHHQQQQYLQHQQQHQQQPPMQRPMQRNNSGYPQQLQHPQQSQFQYGTSDPNIGAVKPEEGVPAHIPETKTIRPGTREPNMHSGVGKARAPMGYNADDSSLANGIMDSSIMGDLDFDPISRDRAPNADNKGRNHAGMMAADSFEGMDEGILDGPRGFSGNAYPLENGVMNIGFDEGSDMFLEAPLALKF